jgi:exonuclease SbcD
VPNVTVGRIEEVHQIFTDMGKVQVVTVPYPMRSRLLNSVECRGMSMSELDNALRQVISANIEALKTKLNPNLPAVLLGHFSVSGAVYGSERAVLLGSDVSVQKSVLADPVFDYVALGHIHKHQNLTADLSGTPPVIYSGSLSRVDFGEEKEDKGFCWVELDRGATTWEFVKTKARPFVTIKVDVRDTENPTLAVLNAIGCQDIRNAVVRLIVQTTPATEALLQDKEIEKALAPASYLASFVKNTEQVERIRLGGTSPESLTPVQLLERYLESKNTPLARVKILTEHASTIFTGD